jgi:hypothetical protein
VNDIVNIGNSGINKLVEYSPEVTNVVKLDVKINGIKRQLQDFTDIDWLYELKRLIPSAQYCDYFVEPKIGATAMNPSYTNVRNIYGLLVGQCYDPKSESGINAGKLASQISIEIQWTSGFSTNNQADIFILHDRWIWMNPNGSTTIDE